MAKKKSKTKGKQVRGFENVARRMAEEQGISIERASHMLAGSTRRQSGSAKRKNPRLKKVKGKPSKTKKMLKGKGKRKKRAKSRGKK